VSELENVGCVARRLVVFAHLQHALKGLRPDANFKNVSEDFAVLVRATTLNLDSEQLQCLSEHVDWAAVKVKVLEKLGKLSDRFGAGVIMFAALQSWFLMFYAGSVELHQAISLKGSLRQPNTVFSDLKRLPLFSIANAFRSRQQFWEQHEQLRHLRARWVGRFLAEGHEHALRDATMELYHLFQNH
jgi:hypothetical protein